MRGFFFGLLLIANGCGSEVVSEPRKNDAPPDPDEAASGSTGSIAGTGGGGAGSGSSGGTATGGGGGMAGSPAAEVTWSGVDGLAGCQGHTATELEDGTVLVVGDCWTPDFTPVGAGIIDAASGVFGAVSAPGARAYHTATRLEDGSVLVAGGQEAGTGVAIAAHWVYAGNAGFAEGDALAEPRFWHAAARLTDGSVLVTGGNVGDTDSSWLGTDITSSVERVSLGGAGVGPASSMIEARAGHAMVQLAGAILAIGGTAWDHELASVERYDGGNWTPGPSLPQPIGNVAAVPLTNNRIFVVASEGGFVLDQGTWTPTATAGIPTYLGSAAAAFEGDRVLVVASAIYSFGCGVRLYDPALDTWDEVDPGPITCGGSLVTATALADGRVLMVSATGAAVFAQP